VEQDQVSFWAFSLAVYGDAAVQRECLDLQDRYGINVNLLLFCAFAGVIHGAVLSPADVKQAESIVHRWDGEIVSSLRAARRALKSFSGDASSVDFSSLYNSVKAQELEAEKLEQTMLERWGAPLIPRWPKAPPSVAVARNITTLFEVSLKGAPPPGLPNDVISNAVRYAARLQGGNRCQP
jgi:uncharacterized protein (TIGR02444 family)